MVRFWDASSIIPLLVRQAASDALAAEFDRDPVIVAWWGTEVECTSAIARLAREGRLEAFEATMAYGRLEAHAGSWHEVQPSARLRRTSERLLRVHSVRASDALQLAAAIIAADDDPRSLPFVTLDERLARTAELEGFRVVEPA